MNSETLEKAIDLAFELKGMMIDKWKFDSQIEEFEYLLTKWGKLTSDQQKELRQIQAMRQYRIDRATSIRKQLNVIRAEVAKQG